MDPLTLAMILGPQILGGVMGQISSGGEREAAAQANAKAMEYLQSVGVPSIEAQQIILQNPEFVGQFRPEAESAVNLGPSRMEDIQVDPRLKEAQMGALSQLQQQGISPLTDIEKASLGQARRDVAQEAQARQGAILQSMQERGAGGSGMELAARLASSQQAMQQAGEQTDRMKAMAQQRALEAIAQAGQLGGQMRGQEFGEQSNIASAADAIARFNAANQQSVQERNVGARNVAAEREASLRQQLENMRAGTANTQQQYNKALIQQQFENEMLKARGLSGASSEEAARHGQQAAQTTNMWSQLGSGVSQGLMGAQYLSGIKKPTAPTTAPAKSTPIVPAPTEPVDPTKPYSTQPKNWWE